MHKPNKSRSMCHSHLPPQKRLKHTSILSCPPQKNQNTDLPLVSKGKPAKAKPATIAPPPAR